MFGPCVKVFMLFMGGPLFMMFGGLAVLLWGTWLTKARNIEDRELKILESLVAKRTPSISINQLACFKKAISGSYKY